MHKVIDYKDLLKEIGIDEEDFNLAVSLWNKRKGGGGGKHVAKQITTAKEKGFFTTHAGSPVTDQVIVAYGEESAGYFVFKDVKALVKALKKRVEKIREEPVTLHERTYYARVNKYGHYWMGKGPRFSKNLDWKRLPTWATKESAQCGSMQVVEVKVRVEIVS